MDDDGKDARMDGDTVEAQDVLAQDVLAALRRRKELGP